MTLDAFTTIRPAPRVLVVEDEPTLAQNIGIYLSAMGGEVRVSGDGAAAIAQGREFAPDVLVLDYNLPDMDGFAVLDALRRAGCRCPCVLITGHPGSRVSEEVRRRGIAHVLFKPFALADLAARVLGTQAAPR
ncbi:response regulator [Pseudomonas stutzeri]|nr:response regulator [Stutzerimonas stutzeri]